MWIYTPDIAEFLLDLSNGLKVGCAVEGVSTHEEKLDQIAGDVSSCNVQSAGEVREGKSVVDGDDVCYSVTGVDDDASGQT